MSWKTTAIILLLILILENILFGYVIYLGSSMEKLENECSINVCVNADFYYYDSYEKICYCYQDDEIIKSEFIG